MRYTTVKNPSWSSAEKVLIDCVVGFEELGEVPFTASPNDTYAHGVEIYNRCIAGDFGVIQDYEPKPDEGPQDPSEIYNDPQKTISTVIL